MASQVDIIDISSDDDDGDEGVAAWLKAMLDDDVVVDEFLSAGAAAARKGDSDDDCVVLDGDPDKPVEITDDGGGGGGGEEDELLIVGEKGQIACRDYPHPRHLCATFLFSSTPHEKHCNLCHCYVCDTPAPCIYWFGGIPNNDHCHSTDKDSKWKYLRKAFKQRDTLSLPSQKLPERSPVPTLPPTLSSRSNFLRPCPASATITGPPARPQPLIPAAHNSSTRTGGPRDPRLGQFITRSHSHPPTANKVVPLRDPRLGQFITRSHPHPPTTNKVVPLRDPRLGQFITRSHSHTPTANKVLPQKRSAEPIPAPVMQHQAKIRKNVMWRADPLLRAVPQQYEGLPPADLVEENMKTWQNVLDGVAADIGVGDNRSGVEAQDTSSSIFAPLAVIGDFAPQSSTAGFRYDWSNNDAVGLPPVVTREPALPAVVEAGGMDPLFEFINDPWASIPGV